MSLKHSFISPKQLRKAGILGMNERNGRIILERNPRSGYQLVDNKILTKEAAQKANLPIPPTYGIVRRIQQTQKNALQDLLKDHSSFVIKPASGAGGKGVLVVKSKRHATFFRPSGKPLQYKDIKTHLIQTIGGVYSLGGRRDEAIMEYRIESDPQFSLLSFQGAPDLRIIVSNKKVLLAMVRCATSESDGKANLHQGGIGIGLDIKTGKTTHAYHKKQYIKIHPDTDESLVDIKIPNWEECHELALKASKISELGFIGIDIMIDQNLGPLLIEMNARPGLAIQLANKQGLLPLL